MQPGRIRRAPIIANQRIVTITVRMKIVLFMVSFLFGLYRITDCCQITHILSVFPKICISALVVTFIIIFVIFVLILCIDEDFFIVSHDLEDACFGVHNKLPLNIENST